MLKALTALWRRNAEAGNTGAVVVELGLSAPLVLLFLVAVVDYGGLMNVTESLLGATRAGAQYAKATWLDPSASAATGTQTQVCGFYGISGSSCSPVTPSAADKCYCVDGTTGTGTGACPGGGGTNPCAAKADTRVFRYVTVTATQNYQPLLPYAGFTYPPNPLTVQSVVRVE